MPTAASPRTSRAFHSVAAKLAITLRTHRLSRRWSLREAAAQIGVGVAVLRRLEAGQGNPSLAVLLSLAVAYEMELVELLGSLKISSRRSRGQSLRRGRAP